mgnify:CR=1 FL=1
MTLSVAAMADMDVSTAHAEQGTSADTETAAKKRKRTRKANSGKRFECKHEGCGKSYSRAEHLYRHQLNRTPSTASRTRQIANLALTQTPPSKSTDATSRTAIAPLCGRISASAIASGTRRMAPSSRSATALPRRRPAI